MRRLLKKTQREIKIPRYLRRHGFLNGISYRGFLAPRISWSVRLGKPRPRGESAKRCDVDLGVLRPRFPLYLCHGIYLFIYLPSAVPVPVTNAQFTRFPAESAR